MVATPSKLVAFAAVATYCLLATVTATPLDKNPVTLTGESAPLTASHPAFGGPMRGNIIEAVVLDDDVAAAANSMTITNSSAVEVRTAGEGARRSLEGAAADMQKLQAHFGRALELNYKTLVDKYRSASSSPIPWPASYWPVYQDSINARWTNEPSPAEKYATAFKKNVKQFMDNVSYLNGIDQVKNPNFNGNKVKCTSDSNCASLRDGSKCAIREGAKSGYCIPTWWGICHAWAPASNWEPEPKCDVVKNGVTFHAADLKGLLTAVWDGAEIQTVFTGSRFNGPDEPKELDKYGRFTDAFRRDLGAGFFHLAISNIMGINKHSFIVDVAAGAEVWNHPVRSYQVVKSELMDVKKASQEYFGTSSYPFNNKAKYLAYTKTRLSWIVEGYEDGALIPDRADEYTRSADYEYFVELDGSYNIIGGEWLGATRYEHPDFLWFAKGTPNPNTVTALGLSYKEVRALVEESVACKNTPTPAPTTVKPTTKPTETPETPKPTDNNTSKPPATSEPSTPEPSTGKPGKPTETPATPEPTTGKPSTGKPDKPTETPVTPEPSTGKPGKPTETPVPSSGEGKPTPAPETPKPSGKPTPPEPTGPAPVKPAEPTPAPDTSKPSGKPTPSEPIGPAPVKPAPPSDEDRPTPAPSTPGGKPTPPEPSSPATVKPIGGEPTSAPSDDDSSDDVPPTPTTGSPATGDGKPTPVPSKPTDDDSSDDDDEPTPVPTKVTPPSDGGKPSPTTGAPSSEGTPSPTVKPTKKPKNCHA